MMEGLSSRAYESDTICKGGHELMPGEKARTPYPWRKYSACPHCGSKGQWEQNDTTGHCLKCSTWLFRDGRAPWSRDNNKTLCRKYKNKRTAVCCEPDCNETFKTASSHVNLPCPKCRDRIRKANNSRYRKEAREKAKEATCGS